MTSGVETCWLPARGGGDTGRPSEARKEALRRRSATGSACAAEAMVFVLNLIVATRYVSRNAGFAKREKTRGLNMRWSESWGRRHELANFLQRTPGLIKVVTSS
jgi:hypothetical protein